MPKTDLQKRSYYGFVVAYWEHILLMYIGIPVCAIILAFGFIRPSMVTQNNYWYKLVITILVLLLAYALADIAKRETEDNMNFIDREFANENKELVRHVDKIYQDYLNHDFVYYSMIAAIVCVVATLVVFLLSVFIHGLLPVAYVILDLTIIAVIVMFELDTLY